MKMTKVLSSFVKFLIYLQARSHPSFGVLEQQQPNVEAPEVDQLDLRSARRRQQNVLGLHIAVDNLPRTPTDKSFIPFRRRKAGHQLRTPVEVRWNHAKLIFSRNHKLSFQK